MLELALLYCLQSKGGPVVLKYSTMFLCLQIKDVDF
jgi:hypothetical protein